MKRAALVLVVVGIAIATVLRSAPPAVSEKDGLAAFETVRVVLQNPRCQNCHIPGDAPLQLDAGVTHAQNVLRGKDGKGSSGLACATCHGSVNPPSCSEYPFSSSVPTSCTGGIGCQSVRLNDRW